MSDGKVSIQFEIYQEGKEPRAESISRDLIKIGRLPSSHLRLDDTAVSRIHAVVERRGSTFFIIDRGSNRGTYVNDKRISKQQIQNGDQIRIGNTYLNITLGYPQEVATHIPEPAYQEPVTQQIQGDSPEHPEVFATSPVQPFTSEYSPAPEPTLAPTPEFQQSESFVQAPSFAQPTFPATGSPFQMPPQSGIPGISAIPGISPVVNYGTNSPQLTKKKKKRRLKKKKIRRKTNWAVRTSDVKEYSSRFLADYYTEGIPALEVASLWRDHVIKVDQFRKPQTLLIGENKKCYLPISDSSIIDPLFPIIKASGSDAVLHFTSGMKGVVYIGDQQHTLNSLIEMGVANRCDEFQNTYTLPITLTTRIKIEIGVNTILLHYISLPSLKIAPWTSAIFASTGILLFLFVSIFVHALVMVIVYSYPPDSGEFRLDNFDTDNRFVQALVTPEEEPVEEEEEKEEEEEEDEGEKAKEDEGKMGKPDEPEVKKRSAIKGPVDKKDIELARKRDREIAMKSGVLGALNDNNEFSSIWGSEDSAVGSDAITVMGGVDGPSIGGSGGGFGLGIGGAGRGGGGTGQSSYGIGKVGTRGRGGRGRGGASYGKGASDLGERTGKVPTVVPGRPKVTGALDKKTISRIIRQHRNEIKYCYETELKKHKNLQGRVIIKFTIDGTGSVRVASVQESSLKNKKVEKCMVGKIKHWVFPAPKGGGIVNVNYPFVFKAD